MMIANTDNQYLVPTSGNPIRGLIQDHVVAGVWMTSQNTFFDREEYFQLLYGALRPENEPRADTRLCTLPPAIWKPKPLWTGKQIVSVSTILCATFSQVYLDFYGAQEYYAISICGDKLRCEDQSSRETLGSRFAGGQSDFYGRRTSLRYPRSSRVWCISLWSRSLCV